MTHVSDEMDSSLGASTNKDHQAASMVLGVCGNAVSHRDGQWYIHHSFGRVLGSLAPNFEKLRYYSGEAAAGATGYDYPLSARNISVHPWGRWKNTLGALKRPHRLLANYRKMVKECDALLVRGSMPLIWSLHLMARLQGRPVVHWIAGNPLAIMRGQKRGYGRALETLGTAFASFEQRMLKLSMRMSRAAVLANGQELGKIFASPRTQTIVSTSISRDEFLVRDDTCTGERIRILFVGFIRPEKGIEFLIRALPLIQSSKPVELAVVGAWDQFESEHKRLSALIVQLGLENQVSWEGYASYGADLFRQMDASDILVLPTLSEGTPRVLVEARARSLPIVSTEVGGIPTSVTNGRDGLLVPPRSPESLAKAMGTIIENGELRRSLIKNGRDTVRELTVDQFVDTIVSLITSTPKP
ncbi:MAG: glycosyltransferase family 4 protein [Planctomycetes bacterium]|nr:glycosyltransferase family 4 protein [Planctomycetota bacterium]